MDNNSLNGPVFLLPTIKWNLNFVFNCGSAGAPPRVLFANSHVKLYIQLTFQNLTLFVEDSLLCGARTLGSLSRFYTLSNQNKN